MSESSFKDRSVVIALTSDFKNKLYNIGDGDQAVINKLYNSR